MIITLNWLNSHDCVYRILTTCPNFSFHSVDIKSFLYNYKECTVFTYSI